MGLDPISLAAITIATTGLSAGAQVVGAQQQNKAIKRAAAANSRAAEVKSKQVNDAARVERFKRINEANMVRGRLRVAGSASGGGQFASLLRQAQYDETINQQILDQNTYNELLAVRSGLDANLASLQSQMQSPILSGFIGAIQGASTGLQIGSGINALGEAAAANAATNASGGAVNSSLNALTGRGNEYLRLATS